VKTETVWSDSRANGILFQIDQICHWLEGEQRDTERMNGCLSVCGMSHTVLKCKNVTKVYVRETST